MRRASRASAGAADRRRAAPGPGSPAARSPSRAACRSGLARMKRILDVDLRQRAMRVQPGVINLDVSKHSAPQGYYYAPDPSSQSVCTIGGNVAENSGGAHCLKYGFTVNHVLGAEVVLSDGTVRRARRAGADAPGYDLTGVVVGSEGMLGIVTEVSLRILRAPRGDAHVLRHLSFDRRSRRRVSRDHRVGIVPAAIEMMDRLAIEAVKARPASTGRTSARRS